MVESALFFMVGFLLAALIALLVAPAISRRAMRLATARARLQSPLSESQARAERDALRAVQAVEIVKMEKKLAAADWDRAVARADLGREIVRLDKLTASLGELDEEVRERDERVALLEAELRLAEAESGARDTALWDMTGQRDAAQLRLAAARASIAEQQGRLDRNRVEIATQATQVSALEVELSDVRTGKRRFGGQSAADIEERLQNSEMAREDQTLEIARLMRAATERNAALVKAEAARDDLERQLTASEEQFRQAGARLRSRPPTLSTEPITETDALSDAPEARHPLQDEIDALKTHLLEATASAEALTKGDAALRLAIAKLGRDLVRARAAHDDEPPGAAQIVNFARREPTG